MEPCPVLSSPPLRGCSAEDAVHRDSLLGTPRRRGGVPRSGARYTVAVESSPPTRECSGRHAVRGTARPVLPADAGALRLRR